MRKDPITKYIQFSKNFKFIIHSENRAISWWFSFERKMERAQAEYAQPKIPINIEPFGAGKMKKKKVKSMVLLNCDSFRPHWIAYSYDKSGWVSVSHQFEAEAIKFDEHRMRLHEMIQTETV